MKTLKSLTALSLGALCLASVSYTHLHLPEKGLSIISLLIIFHKTLSK